MTKGSKIPLLMLEEAQRDFKNMKLPEKKDK